MYRYPTTSGLPSLIFGPKQIKDGNVFRVGYNSRVSRLGFGDDFTPTVSGFRPQNLFNSISGLILHPSILFFFSKKNLKISYFLEKLGEQSVCRSL
jgi:hypothetical protein